MKEENMSKQFSLMISSTDIMFQRIAESLAATASSAAAARDKADGFNLCLSEYAARENKVIQGELVDYCECLKAVEDRRQLTLETIIDKLKPACDKWKTICAETQASLKNLCIVRDKEAKALRALEKTKVKEGSKKAQQVSQDVASKQSEVANKTDEIHALMRQFHTQKLNDYKSILATYSQIQMIYHSRSLEFYTRAYQDILDIQADEYVESVLNETNPGTMTLSQSVPQNMNTSSTSVDQLNMTK